MTESEIKLLATRVKSGGVWWHDGDGSIKRVREIKMDWVEFEEEPELVEPAALLIDGKAVALVNEAITAFVTVQPAVRAGAL